MRNPDTRDHREVRRELMLFLVVVVGLGVAGGIFETTFNNFLDDVFAITADARGRLEFPRELPGFLVAVVGGLLFFFSELRLGLFSVLALALGMAGLGFVGSNYLLMIAFMVIWSAGNHLMMPVYGTFALSLAPPHRRAAKMGQIGAVSMAAMILGSIVVWTGLQYLHLSYRTTFLVAAGGALLAAVFLARLRPLPARPARRPKLVLKRRYGLFYLLNVFSGARKQIFITFGPWVLIKVFGEPAPTIAKLYIVASAIGIVLQPQLGRIIDRFGERVVLMASAFLLIGVCLGYGFAQNLPISNPVHVAYACYILDHVLFASGIARTTYLDKIAETEADVHASLSLGVSIDHAVSMTIPTVGGLVWVMYGFPHVFVGAAAIAVLNLIAASRVRLPPPGAATSGQ